jgi:hypothetical protein
VHLLSKHSFDINVRQKELAQEIHGQLGALMNASFYPKLEKLLEKYDQKENVHIFEKVSLQLPTLKEKNWRETISDAMLEALENYLQENISTGSSNTAEAGDAQQTKAIVELTTQREKVNQKVNNAIYNKALLFTFLKQGYLAPNVLIKSIPELVETIEINQQFVTELLSLLKEDARYTVRFVNNLPPAFVEKLISFLQSENSKNTHVPLEWVSLLMKGNAKKETEDFIKLYFFVFDGSVNTSTIIQKQLHILSLFFGVHYSQKLLEETEQLVFKKSLEEGYLNPSFRLLQHITEGIKLFLPSQIKDLPYGDKESKSTTTSEERIVLKAVDKKSTPTLLPDHLFIQNAGLVILHPFIKPLFEKLGYLNNEKIKDEYIHKAICLMQYLVDGEVTFHEESLALNKLLCGIPIEDIVLTRQIINEQEKQICHELLTAVIEHWATLGKTSVQGLQNTFLKRPGKLIFGTMANELTVEESGTDILLNELPWGISYIQLPWMDKSLQVMWN